MMSHRKDLLKKGYRSWFKKGSEVEMKRLGKNLQQKRDIGTYVVAQCLKGSSKNKWELYVK